eukprot:CAMPEP_0119156068 /NCGR_PEP_ID=MMETSP1310-20130426/52070_1 /TAXON_ID=464262 /ORGANISM="Genus nov. species nov., Strain RCC2339" /LENGTH=57 /DNA_ID=CAMNT_0007148677 /DNA_START=624 /DNA_END=794 /DNA_ORIENTATION=+
MHMEDVMEAVANLQWRNSTRAIGAFLKCMRSSPGNEPPRADFFQEDPSSRGRDDDEG